MKFLKKLVLSLLIFFGILAIILLLIPSEYEIKRTIEIDAPPAIVYGFVSNIRNWNKWSPLVANAKEVEYFNDLNPARSGLIWFGNDQDWSPGFLECFVNTPYDIIQYKLSLREGFNRAITSFIFIDKGGKTKLSWSIKSKLDFWYKYLRFYKEKFFGGVLEEGLANLKTLAEKEADIDLNISQVLIPNQKLIAIRDTLHKSNMNLIGAALGMAYTELFQFIDRKKLQIAGPPISINIANANDYIFDAAVPIIAPANIIPFGRIRITKLTGGKAIKAVYTGSYAGIPTAYLIIDSYIANHNLQRVGDSWEEYVNDPVRTPPEELITNIYVPVK